MTTPRDAAVEMVSEMIYRRVVTPILGGSDWEHEPKSENRIQCDELASRIVAALASPPAQGTTLAELVDGEYPLDPVAWLQETAWHVGYAKALGMDIAPWVEKRDEAERNLRALLAYQPPAPVSRAGAVAIGRLHEYVRLRRILCYELDPPAGTLNWVALADEANDAMELITDRDMEITAALAAAEGRA